MWHTWLAYFGLIAGLGASGVLKTPPLHSAGIGIAVAVVVVIVWNLVDPTAAACLQASKGWEILRAYTLCR